MHCSQGASAAEESKGRIMATETAQQLVDSASKLYTLPTIYYRIDEAIQNPNSTTSQIGHIISEDTALSARLLKLVNSVFYNFPSKIDTISGAVTVIGTKQLRDLVLATSVVQIFKGIPDNVINMQDFWLHSIASGVCAKVLATERNESNIEALFVAGLLHDIGSLIIYSQRPEQAVNVLATARKEKALLHSQEKTLLGFSHSEVGGLLVKNWRLPQNLVNTITYHHAPTKARGNRTEACIIHVADVICNALELGTSGERYVPPMDKSAWKALEIDPKQISKMVPIIERQFKETAQIILQDGGHDQA